MKKKMEVKADASNRMLIINGEKYVLDKLKTRKEGKVLHEDYSTFRKVDEDEYNEIAEEIKDALRNKINVERILEEIVKCMTFEKMMKMRRMLKKKKTKVKTHDGCYGIDIDSGNEHEYIQLFE